MELFTTDDKAGRFSFCMSDFKGKAFDNKDALNLRFSLVFVESGSGMAELGGRPVPYIAPCAFCVNELEHIVIPENEGNSIRAIYLHPCIINGSLDFINIRDFPDDAPMTLRQDRDLLRLFLLRENDYFGKFNLGPVSASQFDNLYATFHELICDQQYDNWPCRSRSYLMWLLFLLENLYSVGDYANDKILGKTNEKLEEILIYLYHNYNKKITVADVTERFYISRTTLSKMFAQSVGDTFLSYLNKLRIKMAATVLRDTTLSVNEVMYRVGFTDSVHFFRTFKKYTGYTPSDYKEKFLWMKF